MSDSESESSDGNGRPNYIYKEEENGWEEENGGKNRHHWHGEGDWHESGGAEQQGAGILEEEEGKEDCSEVKLENQAHQSLHEPLELLKVQPTEPSVTDAATLVWHQTTATYAGLIYYEKKGVEDLVTFTAARNLNALFEFFELYHPNAEIGQSVFFRLKDCRDYIELCLNTPQKEPCIGWTIQPHIKPCRLYRQDIAEFGEVNHPLPPSCLISVYGSPDAVPTLHYSIPLEGVAEPVTLFIHRLRRNPFALPKAPSTCVSATVDVSKVKKVIGDVLVSHDADLNSLPVEAISDLANKLYAVHLINNTVRENPSMNKFITEFKASLSFKRKLPQVEEHCQKFLSSFIAARGSCADAAIALGEDWIEAIKNELEFDFNINIDAN